MGEANPTGDDNRRYDEDSASFDDLESGTWQDETEFIYATSRLKDFVVEANQAVSHTIPDLDRKTFPDQQEAINQLTTEIQDSLFRYHLPNSGRTPFILEIELDEDGRFTECLYKQAPTVIKKAGPIIRVTGSARAAKTEVFQGVTGRWQHAVVFDDTVYGWRYAYQEYIPQEESRLDQNTLMRIYPDGKIGRVLKKTYAPGTEIVYADLSSLTDPQATPSDFYPNQGKDSFARQANIKGLSPIYSVCLHTSEDKILPDSQCLLWSQGKMLAYTPNFLGSQGNSAVLAHALRQGIKQQPETQVFLLTPSKTPGAGRETRVMFWDRVTDKFSIYNYPDTQN